MLFASIASFENLSPDASIIDGIELRLDLFPQIDLPILATLSQPSSRPLMFTVRSTSHGGKFSGSEEGRESLIEQLLALEPAFFDLEYDMRQEFIEKMIRTFRKTKIVISYHNFKEVPDLENIYSAMSKYPAYTYKIAIMPHSTSEALKALLFARKDPKVSIICMGGYGTFTRILGPINKNLVNYASLDRAQQTAPGQVSIQELEGIYHYHTLNPKTALYGLIGDPVDKSIGHVHHNSVFEKRHINALYVKMTVKKEELSDFFPLAQKIGFQGLSVTMPLKESVIPFVDHLDDKARQIGAVNTLLFKEGAIFGTNTDGSGALDAIEKKGPVSGKKVVVLGSGGASKAISFEAKQRGADVLILNRTKQKAKEMAASFHCEAGDLTEMPSHYDVLINCTPDPVPIDPRLIIRSALVMDIVYSPKNTPFLLKAQELGCQIVYGEEMFFKQAGAQTAFWME